jgi:hypothetical protein
MPRRQRLPIRANCGAPRSATMAGSTDSLSSRPQPAHELDHGRIQSATRRRPADSPHVASRARRHHGDARRVRRARRRRRLCRSHGSAGAGHQGAARGDRRGARPHRWTDLRRRAAGASLRDRRHLDPLGATVRVERTAPVRPADHGVGERHGRHHQPADVRGPGDGHGRGHGSRPRSGIDSVLRHRRDGVPHRLGEPRMASRPGCCRNWMH